MPIHGNNIPALTSEPLFKISPQSNVLGQRQKMRVEINSVISDLTLKGFMIQARSSHDGSIIGEFSPPQDRLAKVIACGNDGNTATHSSTELKRNVVLEWNAPSDFIGDIVFKYAWGRSQMTFMEKKQSKLSHYILNVRKKLKNYKTASATPSTSFSMLTSFVIGPQFNLNEF